MNTTTQEALNAAGVTNDAICEFAQEWANITAPARVEVVSATNDARRTQKTLDAGELLYAGESRYYARSHVKDTARSEERTVVATSQPTDRGTYNNWHPAKEVDATLRERMHGTSAGKTMYVVPYLMAVPGAPLAPFAAGVQLTDDRTVVLHMIRMARVGLRLIGKISHALRLASYDGWVTGKFLAEQFLLLGTVNTHTGHTYHVCGEFPSTSGKTNLAMTLPPDALGDRYRVEFYGDDIAWLWVGEDGHLYGMNPENGIFGVAKDTNATTNPTAIDAIGAGGGTIFTNVTHNNDTGEVWWEGKTSKPPTPADGWRDWTDQLITDRNEHTKNDPWAHPNSRFATELTNLSTLATDADHPVEVPIDAIIFGGRTSDREPLIRAITDLAEGDYAQHWLTILGQLTHPPIFVHVNWFARDLEEGHYLWPGYRENLRALSGSLTTTKGERTDSTPQSASSPPQTTSNSKGLISPRVISLDSSPCTNASQCSSTSSTFRQLVSRNRFDQSLLLLDRLQNYANPNKYVHLTVGKNYLCTPIRD